MLSVGEEAPDGHDIQPTSTCSAATGNAQPSRPMLYLKACRVLLNRGGTARHHETPRHVLVVRLAAPCFSSGLQTKCNLQPLSVSSASAHCILFQHSSSGHCFRYSQARLIGPMCMSSRIPDTADSDCMHACVCVCVPNESHLSNGPEEQRSDRRFPQDVLEARHERPAGGRLLLGVQHPQRYVEQHHAQDLHSSSK